MFKATVFASFLTFTVYCTQLTGPNICSRQETYTEKVIRHKKQPYLQREYYWCLNFPPRCSRITTKFRNVPVEEEEIKLRSVDGCCEGYSRNSETRTCDPVCDQVCVNGRCFAPQVCDCEEGYEGASCDQVCGFGRYGKNCTGSCSCLNNASCDVKTGACFCPAGFTGVNCERSCPPGTFGRNCEQSCDCLNGASCDPVNGTCVCNPGHSGNKCEKFCDEGNFGVNCEEKCKCKNGKCDPVTGVCNCKPGWAGRSCENWCRKGKYGENCSSDCVCKNDGNCNPVTGFCSCTPGWTGPDCTTPCPDNKWGENCKRNCTCETGSCDVITGLCQLQLDKYSIPSEVNGSCPDGWNGENCTERLCSKGLWGVQCDRLCECNMENTEVCHQLSGMCECKDGWMDRDCSKKCRDGMFGAGCSRMCLCKNMGRCTEDGKCICQSGFFGEYCEKFVFIT